MASNQPSFAGGTCGTSPEKKSDRGVKLAAHFHFLPKLRIRDAMPPVPHDVYGLMLMQHREKQVCHKTLHHAYCRVRNIR